MQRTELFSVGDRSLRDARLLTSSGGVDLHEGIHVGFNSSIRARWASINSTGESSFRLIFSAMETAERKFSSRMPSQAIFAM